MTEVTKPTKAAKTPPVPSAFEQARAKMTDAERALVEAHARLQGITDELARAAELESALKARHTAFLSGRVSKQAPPTHAELFEAQQRRRALESDANTVRTQAVASAELALVQAEEEAADRLREEWDQIAQTAEAELIEVITKIGNTAWRAQIATGRHIDFVGYVRRCAQEAESALIGQGGEGGIFCAPTGVDLPEVLEVSPLIERARRHEMHMELLRAA